MNFPKPELTLIYKRMERRVVLLVGSKPIILLVPYNWLLMKH